MQLEEGSVLERVGETTFNVGATKACYVDFDGLEADLFGEVSSEEAERVFIFSGLEAGPSLGATKVGVPANASPIGVVGGDSNGLRLEKAKGTLLMWGWAGALELLLGRVGRTGT